MYCSLLGHIDLGHMSFACYCFIVSLCLSRFRSLFFLIIKYLFCCHGEETPPSSPLSSMFPFIVFTCYSSLWWYFLLLPPDAIRDPLHSDCPGPELIERSGARPPARCVASEPSNFLPANPPPACHFPFIASPPPNFSIAHISGRLYVFCHYSLPPSHQTPDQPEEANRTRRRSGPTLVADLIPMGVLALCGVP